MAISAVIITLNESRNIRRCIQSLRGVVEEILVVDTGSTDDTIVICQQEKVRCEFAQWKGYAATKNAANQMANFDYVLSLDADEAVSEELRVEILKLKSNLSGAYRMKRKNFFAHQWIRGCGWYPDKKIRLFSRKHAQWQGDFVHETLVVSTHVQEIEGDILHYTYNNDAEFLKKLQTYTDLAAQELYAQGKKSNFAKIYLNPFWRFLQAYFFKKGFLDGYYGALVAWRLAQSVKWKYQKLAKLQSNSTS